MRSPSDSPNTSAFSSRFAPLGAQPVPIDRFATPGRLLPHGAGVMALENNNNINGSGVKPSSTTEARRPARRAFDSRRLWAADAAPAHVGVGELRDHRVAPRRRSGGHARSCLSSSINVGWWLKGYLVLRSGVSPASPGVALRRADKRVLAAGIWTDEDRLRSWRPVRGIRDDLPQTFTNQRPLGHDVVNLPRPSTSGFRYPGRVQPVVAVARPPARGAARRWVEAAPHHEESPRARAPRGAAGRTPKVVGGDRRQRGVVEREPGVCADTASRSLNACAGGSGSGRSAVP